VSILSVKDLVKIYPAKKSFFGQKKTKPFVAVNGISFESEEGEILGFLGPNGAGKTTTIQMLLSILAPTSGSIDYFGKDFFTHRSDILQKVGFASTYVKLPGNLTVYENLDMFGQLYGLSHAQCVDSIERHLRHFGLWDLRNKKARMLSSGESARAMLAKAFLANPRIVLLDEPTAALDPDVAQDVRTFVREQRDQHGVSFLFTSHNMVEVTELCDRVLVLQKGAIIADSTPDQLAESVAGTTIKLFIKEEQHAAFIAHLKELNLHYTKEGCYFEMPIQEADIARFLNQLSVKGFVYASISIEKPKLENYFIQLSRQQRGAS